ncbi:alanine--tRNA ligase [Sulfolobus sp. E1]|nr:alanine--tRNA ligase [Sulfolobus sp. E1]
MCKNCQTPFWTKDEKREVCADIPCTDYYFFDIQIKSNPLTVREAREKFLSFFEKRGHTRIPPKPVLARWREDLYLTIASIVDFQPHVTSGLVPPPANPLVISQPAIRLEDIDNVGVTFGRHLTTFEMAAHHAFNYPDKYIYWKDETTEYAKEFFTEEIGIPESQLNFKESWWEGGGNAGPCLEVTVGGLELATLVFMQYKIEENGNYTPLKLKIVDTGYGVERIAWITQKTPTAFHAIYGDLVYKFFNKIGVPYVDDQLLTISSRFAGRIDPDNPDTIKTHRELVSKELNVDIKRIDEELTRAARVFQVLDHTKTIMMMLADGLVPSNSGEGYLGRLVIRRALRVLKLLGSDVRLYELVKEQLDFWKEDFPQVWKNKDYILDVIELEQQKFENVVSKIPSIVSSISKKKEVNTEDLIEIYDSNGIPPDLVSEELKKRGIKVDIPHNFYGLVAKRHQTSSIKEKERQKLPKEVMEIFSKVPSTEKLYYKDQYMRSFEAKVIQVFKNYIVLDRTAFYPEGGGQLGDTGVIYDINNNENYKVIDTQKVGEVVVHVLDKEPKIKAGDIVKGEIDWERRYRLMRHHTATHIILASAKRVLGDHVWQAGAEKTPEKGRLDITHHKPLTEEEIKLIEDYANKVIADRRPVRPIEINRIEAEMKYGVSIYEGGVPNSAIIRLLEIKDWDIESCGGTHVSNTSEIGSVKIINVEKIQDGVIRLEYVAGSALVDYTRELEKKIDEISKIINVDSSQVASRLKRILDEKNNVEELLSHYRKIYENLIISTIKPYEINGIKIYVLEGLEDEEEIKEITRKITYSQNNIVVSITDNKLQIGTSKNIDVSKIVEEFRKIGGRGGGKGTFANILLDQRRSKEQIIEIIKRGILV